MHVKPEVMPAPDDSRPARPATTLLPQHRDFAAPGPAPPAAPGSAGMPQQQHTVPGVLDLVADLHLFELQLGLLRQQAHKLAADRATIDQQLQEHYPGHHQQLIQGYSAAAAAKLQQDLAAQSARVAAELANLQCPHPQQHQQQEAAASPAHANHGCPVNVMQWLQAAAPTDGISRSRPLKRSAGFQLAAAAALPQDAAPAPGSLLQATGVGGVPGEPAFDKAGHHTMSAPVKRPRHENPRNAALPAIAARPAAVRASPGCCGTAAAMQYAAGASDDAALPKLLAGPSSYAASAGPLCPAAGQQQNNPLQPVAAAHMAVTLQPSGSSSALKPHAVLYPAGVFPQTTDTHATVCPPKCGEMCNNAVTSSGMDIAVSSPAQPLLTQQQEKQQQRSSLQPQPQLQPQEVQQAAGCNQCNITTAAATAGASAGPSEAVTATVALTANQRRVEELYQAAEAGPSVTIEHVFQPLSPNATAAAWRAVDLAAAAADAALASQPLHLAVQGVLADAAKARQLVELVCPVATALAALPLQQRVAAMHNLPVEDDVPQRYKYVADVPPCEAQLLCKSGLLVAASGKQPRSVWIALISAANSATGIASQGDVSCGLLSFVVAAHKQLVQQLASPVGLPQGPAAVPAGQHLKQVIKERVDLAQLVLLAYNLLERGHLRQQPPVAASGSAAAAGDSRTGGAALNTMAQQQEVQRLRFVFPALTSSDRQHAQAALTSWVLKTNRTPGVQGPAVSRRRVCSAAGAREVLLQFCPAAAALLELTRDTAGELHNLQVEADSPSAWQYVAGAQLQEAQLLTHSGLVAACAPLRDCSNVHTALQAAAAAAAAASSGMPGSGLLGFFFTAQQLLVQEVCADVVQAAGSSLCAGDHFRLVVLGRIYLAELLLVVYGLLKRGHVQQPPEPATTAAVSAAALLVIEAALSAGAMQAAADGAAVVAISNVLSGQRGGSTAGPAAPIPPPLQPQATVQAQAQPQFHAPMLQQQQQQQHGQAQPQQPGLAVSDVLLQHQPLSQEARATGNRALVEAAAASTEAARLRRKNKKAISVADSSTVQKLVGLYCPVLQALMALHRDNSSPLGNLQLCSEDDKWMGSSAAHLQVEQLTDAAGLRAACIIIKPPEGMRLKLNNAIAAAKPAGNGLPGPGLRQFFFTLLELFQQQMKSNLAVGPTCIHTVRKSLKQTVLNQAYWAELLVLLFTLLKRGTVSPQQLQGVRAAAVAAGAQCHGPATVPLDVAAEVVAPAAASTAVGADMQQQAGQVVTKEKETEMTLTARPYALIKKDNVRDSTAVATSPPLPPATKAIVKSELQQQVSLGAAAAAGPGEPATVADGQAQRRELPFAALTPAARAAAAEALRAAQDAAPPAAAAGNMQQVVRRVGWYKSWRVLATLPMSQRLLCVFVPAAEELAKLRQQHCTNLHQGLLIQRDQPIKWKFAANMVVQEAQLLDESGLKAACNLQSPQPLRRRLYAALDASMRSMSSLLSWFWAAHGLFLEEWDTEACVKPQSSEDAEVLLKECIESRARFAELLIMVYNLLLRGHLAQQ